MRIEIEITAPLASSRSANESASPSDRNFRPRNGDEHALHPPATSIYGGKFSSLLSLNRHPMENNRVTLNFCFAKWLTIEDRSARIGDELVVVPQGSLWQSRLRVRQCSNLVPTLSTWQPVSCKRMALASVCRKNRCACWSCWPSGRDNSSLARN